MSESKQKEPLVNFKFEDMKVSTRTFTATTNITMNIFEISNALPVYATVDTRLRGSKGDSMNAALSDIPTGSIISVNYLGKIRGFNLKPRKKNKRWFRNSFTVVIHAGDKLINFKVCRNGTFQITGALSFQHAVHCIKCVWQNIKNTKHYSINDGRQTLHALIIPAMRNLDFTLGIKINREMFDKYIIDKNDKYHCLLETSFGYTGLNVKKKITKPISKLKILELNITNDSDWAGNIVTYEKYLDILSPDAREAKIKHTRYNTFLVFHSGKIIQSGMSSDFMKDDFYDFCEIINNAYRDGFIEEKLDE
jgi:TATA-box binding protein (TBP) (component of TFIID and TFIIIB)